MISLGAIYPAAVNLTDASGNPANASTVVLTITLPDTTTVTPSVINPPAVTGAYSYPYLPVQPGRHTVSWVFTGPNAAYTDTFDVAEANPPSIISLADVKQQLDIPLTETVNDAELLQWLYTSTQIIEQYKHEVIARRTVTEIQGNPNTFPYYYQIGMNPKVRLHYTPVISLTSIVAEDGSFTWTVSNFDVDAFSGLITCLNGPPITGRVVFVYSAGYTVIPYNYLIGCRMLFQHLWESRRGPGGESGMVGPEELSDFRHYTSLPRKVAEMLGPARPVVA